ncbi:hypothetical protein M0R79_00705 [Ignavigranum ruoffiae]|uniref:hypothetical protein n=1 Tax=Ignavigranum ruoffiae TaxID=89093 RepID=UPI00205A5DEB|nr:hypothetical protein [Ignavigranum ruoffiae]UPQ85929.1 hypothetical protein M0R79_00705 [Ignavigranum ruoffiae]
MKEDANFSLITFIESRPLHDGFFNEIVIQLNVISKEVSIVETKYYLYDAPAIDVRGWYKISAKKDIETSYSKNARRIKNPLTQDQWKQLATYELREEVVRSRGIKLSEEQIKLILPYCKVSDFEPYRNRKMDMKDPGYIGYRDGVSMEFIGVSNSGLPVIQLPMDYYFTAEYEWPSERLYRVLVTEVLNKDSRFDDFMLMYGGLSIFFRFF